MRKRSVRCALLAALLARHAWGSPIPRERLLAFAAIGNDEYPRARAVFDRLREARYVANRGKRGLELDTGEFDVLADVLYHDCDWDPFEIRLRLKHYEGWDDHEWTESGE